MRVLLAILALLWAAPAIACTVEVRNDHGGPIEQYEARLADYNRRGCRVELHETITSSATIFLGADHVCLGLPMSANFHRPTWNGRKMAPVDFQYWKRRLASHYPPAIRRWFLVNIQNDGRHWTVRRDELIRIGVPAC